MAPAVRQLSKFATAMLVSYDGSRGWAWDPTIRGTIADTLERILREPVAIEAASRTDAGVHAIGQALCAFTSREPLAGDLQLLRYRANQLLPEDVVLRQVVRAPADFDVRDNAGKVYCYYINTAAFPFPLSRRTEWHLPSRRGRAPFDAARAQQAASYALGRHSFLPFSNAQPAEPEREPVCELRRLDVVECGGGRIRLDVEGDRFLYRMVRNLAGTVARCGSGELEPELVERILATGAWPSDAVKLTAPAHGLVLHQVLLHADCDPFASTAAAAEEVPLCAPVPS
ncbi:hypothetical protein KFE25_006743 [Diacronema lutheri]|uniref:tRNA pseudouridine synthase n=1 Tax=Diacronema lutheri TaxID=2081491 RepID=A0A8J6CE16_DIALT|nr:hypothetical protein KFE25_006743 [Diacronema lutheri]